MSKRGVYILIILLFTCHSAVQANDLSQYILGPDDVLEVSVWNHPDLNKRVIVRNDGYISLPLVGEIKVTGLTTLDVTQKIEKTLENFIQSPQAAVSVVGFKKINVSIMGAVRESGRLEVDPGTRLLEVLAMGGIREETAYLEEVSLTRNNTVLRVDVERLLVEGGHQNYLLHSGDIIYIPTKIRKVYIIGEVVKPGEYRIDKKTMPADLLAMAGGPTDEANLEKIKIIRRNSSGESMTVNLKNYLEAEDPTEVIYLEDGDVIHVLEARSIDWDKIFSYAAGIKIIHDLIVGW